MLSLIKLFLSNDVQSSIRTQVALARGYDRCDDAKSIAYKKQKCNGTDYVWSEENHKCFRVVNVSTNFVNGFSNICNQSMIDFKNDGDIQAFIRLVKSGIYC